MRGEGVTDYRKFVWQSIEEPTAKVIDFCRVHRQEREAGVEFLPGIHRCPAVLLPQEPLYRVPLAILDHRVDHARHLRSLRIKNPLH